ncbi:hypothetical protein BJ122_11720 [Rhodopseudomonas faecalis]|uniref:Immunity MXAN-0049 protein domain-containing protein n=1 Tax=Rhodopseudomonas faecalis TaxID=99655 RepID=A0A318TDA6_9BRAD|nr:DUF1629 domain-containing protein [Rhodopseudomonas faecalis]PYF01797.1 hypothetical protein BJ122_11720 [Rhodopseudomonas faecalis]TAH66366.1 MAG: hypothetical protein EWM45_11615 [Rhodopseudomonas palustris]
MNTGIMDLIHGNMPGSKPRAKPPRLYLGSPEKFIDIDDEDVFQKTTIPEMEARGWNAISMEPQHLIQPVPPARQHDDPVRHYLLGIDGRISWPRARPQHHILKFQKRVKPRSSEQDASSKLWRYFHPEGWKCGDPEIGSKDYDEAQRALSELVPRYGLFRKGLYTDIGYESFVSDDRGRGMLKVVNTAFKDAIEAVEPRIHHFFPYEIRCDDGRIAEDYWIFVHRGSVRAIDPIASCFIEKFRDDGTSYFSSYVPWMHTEAAENRIVVRADAMAGRHYAVDDALSSDRPIISAALAERLRPILWKNQTPVPVITRNG